MAIRIHLGRLLGERKMKMAELSRITGISKNALSVVYYEKVKAIRFDTLGKICEALQCPVGELIEYQPDNKDPEQGGASPSGEFADVDFGLQAGTRGGERP